MSGTGGTWRTQFPRLVLVALLFARRSRPRSLTRIDVGGQASEEDPLRSGADARRDGGLAGNDTLIDLWADNAADVSVERRRRNGTVRPPSPESAVASSRKDALNREPTFGLAGAAVEKPVEEPLTSPDGAPELSGAFDPSSAGAGSLGGGTESVVPLTASEPLRRFGGRLLLAEACVVEKPGAAGTVLVAPMSSAPAPPAASGAVPGEAVVTVGSVPVGVGSEGVGVHPGACGALPGEAVVAVGSVPVRWDRRAWRYIPALVGSCRAL